MTPMNWKQWQRKMAKWDTFENVLGTRDTLWEDIEEFGTLTLSDACLHKRLINDVPSFAEMLEKEAEIKTPKLVSLAVHGRSSSTLIKTDMRVRFQPMRQWGKENH